jgi:hypothetical protein
MDKPYVVFLIDYDKWMFRQDIVEPTIYGHAWGDQLLEYVEKKQLRNPSIPKNCQVVVHVLSTVDETKANMERVWLAQFISTFSDGHPLFEWNTCGRSSWSKVQRVQGKK